LSCNENPYEHNLCSDIRLELPLFPTNLECSSQAQSGVETGSHGPESSVDEMAQSQKRNTQQKRNMQPDNDPNTMKKKGRKGRKTNLKEQKVSSSMAFDETNKATQGTKTKKVEEETDWDELRKTYSSAEPRGNNHMDSVDWEAVRCAENKDVADAIKERGQQNIIAGRIKVYNNIY